MSKNTHYGRVLPFTLFREIFRIYKHLLDAESEDWQMCSKEDFDYFADVIVKLKDIYAKHIK